MQELLIVNPSKRPSKRRKSTKAASPAQKRARAAFAARSRARSGTKTAKRRTRRAAPALSVMSNPRRRRHVAKASKRASRRRSNPLSMTSVIKKPMAMLTPALTGALGAIAVNTILSKLPIPASMNTGKMKYVTQGVAAIALAMIASKVGVKGAMAAQMAEGSLTVTLHDAIKDIASGFGMNLSGMGYYLPGVGAGRAVPSRAANPGQMAMQGMGKYISGPGAKSSGGSLRGMGKVNTFRF